MSNNASSENRPGLIRALGPWMAIAVVVGTVIGSGVFKKPQVVAENVPFFGIAALVWVLGGLLALLGGLALAEIAVQYPRAGGNYVYLREGYGPLAGFLFGWVEFWVIRSASIAALATIFTESLHDILRSPAFQNAIGIHLGENPLGFWDQRWLTIVVILGLAGVNVLGVRWGGLLQLFITSVKITSLIAIALLPLLVVWFRFSAETAPQPQVENLRPFWPDWQNLDFSKVGAALVGVLWAYHGWMNIAPIAEEVRSPQKNIPVALLGGIGIIAALYLGANMGYCLIIPQQEIAGIKDTTVVAEYCLRLLGPLGAAAASAAVMCSVFGALSGNLLVGPRLLYAMGEDGLAPRALGRAHPRFHTPALAIIVLGVWSCLLVLAGGALMRYDVPFIGRYDKPLFDIMTDFAIFGAVIFETLAVTTIFAFRFRFPNRERAYRCPGYPVVPVVYVLIMSLVATNMFIKQRTEAVTGVAFVGVGVVVYFLIRAFGPPLTKPIKETVPA